MTLTTEKKRRIKKDGRVMSIWFSADVLRRLDLLADSFNESRSTMVNDLLEERLSYYEEIIAAAEQKEAVQKKVDELNKALQQEKENESNTSNRRNA